MFEEKLKKEAEKFNIFLNQDQLYKFKIYYKLLVEFNQKYNLTTITEEDEVIKKHFIDSLMGLPYIRNEKIIDIGAGAGFPGIVLKIVDDVDLTLIDSVKKKTDFMEIVVSQLGLKNVKILHGRIEDFAQDKQYREQFDICVSRAVAPLNILAEYSLPFLKRGGKMLAYKSKQLEDEAKEAKYAIEKMGGAVSNVYEMEKDDMVRNIIEIKKITVTPSIYPRGKNQPRKRPL